MRFRRTGPTKRSLVADLYHCGAVGSLGAVFLLLSSVGEGVFVDDVVMDVLVGGTVRSEMSVILLGLKDREEGECLLSLSFSAMWIISPRGKEEWCRTLGDAAGFCLSLLTAYEMSLVKNKMESIVKKRQGPFYTQERKEGREEKKISQE